MKKVVFGVLALSLFASCSNDDSNELNDNQIRLSANVVDRSVKTITSGPINANFSDNFPIGIYATQGTAWKTGATNYINNDASTVSGAVGHSVAFNSTYYYPADGSSLYFYAFAPYATETTAAVVNISPKVTHTIDGHQDVMWASAIGYKNGSAPAVAPILNFAHKLTQLQFTFKAGTAYPVAGNTVTSLLVKSQPTALVMNVQTGTYTSSGSADMQAIAVADQTAGLPITGAGADANSPIMTVPVSGTSAYLIDVTVKTATGVIPINYTNIPVNVTTAMGSSHMIILTFNETGVTATTTVANWVPGTGGTAVVE